MNSSSALRVRRAAGQPPLDPQHLGQLAADGQRRVQVRGGVLEHRADVGAVQPFPAAAATGPSRRRRRTRSSPLDGAALRQHAEGGPAGQRLAAARLPDQARRSRRCARQRDAAHRGGGPVVHGDVQVLDAEDLVSAAGLPAIGGLQNSGSEWVLMTGSASGEQRAGAGPVAEGVGERVERADGDRDQRPGDERRPGRLGQVVEVGGEHAAPGRGRRLDADAEEGEERDGQQRARRSPIAVVTAMVGQHLAHHVHPDDVQLRRRRAARRPPRTGRARTRAWPPW